MSFIRPGRAPIAVAAPQEEGGGALLPSFSLTSTSGGTDLPFAIGHAFKKGDVPSGSTLGADSAIQVTSKATWSDGSLKFAIIAGQKTLTANTPADVTLQIDGTVASGTNIATSDLASVTASIDCGSIGTASWSSSDWPSPFETLVTGPVMSSWLYRKAVGGDAHIVAWLEVRAFLGGAVEVLAWVENGYLDVSSPTARTETFAFTLAGTERYSGSLTLYPRTSVVLASGWPVAHWVSTDPAVIPSHDTDYLDSTKLVPHYWKRSPSTTALNALVQTYTPGGVGSHTAIMGSAGYQNAIGLLPQWEAMYCTSGDSRAYKATEVNSAHFRSFATTWRDSATNLPVRPSLRPTWTVLGAGGGGDYTLSAGSTTWELNHIPSAGFLAYLISGRRFHYDTMALSCATCYLSQSSTQGSGVNRLMNAEDRGTAWIQRSMGQLAAIGGSEAAAADYRATIAATITWWKTNRVEASGINLLGYIHSYQLATNAYGTGRLGPWMHSWWIAANGYLYDMEALDSQTDLVAVRDWMYKAAVGYLGVSGDVNSHSFTQAGQYSLKVAATTNNDPTTWYDSWGTVHTESYGSSNSSASNTLAGSPELADEGNGWGEMLGAIAYAVDHVAVGAAAAWARLSGATNFSSMENSGFDDRPQFGIVKRSTSGNSAMAVLAASMTAGQWAQMTPSGLTTAMFETGASNTIDYLDKGCHDPVNKQIRFIGGGHLTDLRWHQYDETTNAWSVLVDPPWDDGSPESSASQPSTGGAPSFNFHGYQNNALDPATGDQYLRMFGTTALIRRYTRATDTWSTISPIVSGSTGVAATEWLPGIGTEGGLITLKYGDVQRWDKAAATFTNFTLGSPRLDHPIAVRSVPNNVVLFGGGDGDSNLYSIGPTGGITTRTACPIGMGVTQSVTTACPVSGDLIVIGGSSNARKYNVATDTWSTLTFSGAPAALPADIADTTYVMAVPIPAYGVIAFLFPTTPSMWLYKHA